MKPIALFVAILLAAAPAARAQQPPVTTLTAEEIKQKKLDDEMAEKVVGKWTMEIKEKSIAGTVVNTYRKNAKEIEGTFGTFEGVAHLTAAGNQKYDITISGIWRIDKGGLECTVEKCSANSPVKGDKLIDKVVALTDKELKLRNKKGEDENYKRVVEN